MPTELTERFVETNSDRQSQHTSCVRRAASTRPKDSCACSAYRQWGYVPGQPRGWASEAACFPPLDKYNVSQVQPSPLAYANWLHEMTQQVDGSEDAFV